MDGRDKEKENKIRCEEKGRGSVREENIVREKAKKERKEKTRSEGG